MSLNKFNGLESFIKVAELGSFSHAADNMGVSKSYVSRQVGQLETRLSVQLFVRTTRSVTLTTLGQSFYQRIKQSLDQIDEAEQAVVDLQEVPKGTLKVTLAGAFGEQFVVPAAVEFMTLYPNLKVNLNFSNNMIDIVSEGYDLAIRSGVLDDPSLIARRIISRKLLLCASPAYLTKNGFPATLDELIHHNCLLGSKEAWDVKNTDGKDIQFNVSGNWRSNNGYALMQACINHLGIVQLPEFYCIESIQQQKLIEILPQCQPKDNGVWAIYPSNRHLSAKVRLFVDYVIAYCQKAQS
jgi:DNA-binding transcriptional LysR family regulator